MKYRLRDYQQASVDWTFKYFETMPGNPLICMPTGTGKSVVITGIFEELFRRYPIGRAMMVTHAKELIGQNFEKLIATWPNAPAGIYSASMGRKESHYPITYAGIQSVYNKAHLFGHIDLVIVDEAHLISPNEKSSYQRFASDLKAINPQIRFIGLTATPYRLGYGKIYGQEDSFFNECSIDLTSMDSFNWFIDEGYLVPIVPRKPEFEIDVSGVHTRGGEFIESELQLAVNKDEITGRAIESCVKHYSNLDKWLVFCTGIDHAKRVADIATHDFGIPTKAIHSKLSQEERERILNELRYGDIQSITNNNILTTGFDLPALKLEVILRPTMSPGLWVQMLGRLTRPNYAAGYDLSTREGRLLAIANSDKPFGVVADFSANSAKIGCINDPLIPKRKGEAKGDPIVKVCPLCQKYNHGSVKICTCGHEFLFQTKLKPTEAGRELIKRDNKPVIEDYAVDKVLIQRNVGKHGKKDTLNMIYQCGHLSFREYICIEHDAGSFPRRKAMSWWKQRSDLAMPSTIEQALEVAHELRIPSHIRVETTQKHPEILGYCFTGDNFGKESVTDFPPKLEVIGTVKEQIANIVKKQESDIPDFDSAMLEEDLGINYEDLPF